MKSVAALKARAAELEKDAEPVALPGELVIKALLAMDAEARRRGEMYPQTRDEQEADTKAVRNVIASLEFYTTGRQVSANGWPSVKDWPALPATTVAALQARVAELEEALSDLLDAERFSNRPPETVMQAEEKLDRLRAAAATAREALRSKK